MRDCACCGKHGLHKARADNPKKPQPYCVACQKTYLAEYRKKNWQRDKARNTLKGIVNRCRNPDQGRTYSRSSGVPRYEDYGGRGVRVCDRWADPEKGLENFIADVGLPPERASTLDRRKWTRGYTPSNCRWVDKKTQDENRRTTHWVEAQCPDTGEWLTLSITGWSKRTGIKRTTIHARIRRGWEDEQACTTRVGEIGQDHSEDSLDEAPF